MSHQEREAQKQKETQQRLQDLYFQPTEGRTAVSHEAMAKGFPGITAKEKKGARLNELQLVAIRDDGKIKPGFIAFDFGSAALKVVFTAQVEEETRASVIELSKVIEDKLLINHTEEITFAEYYEKIYVGGGRDDDVLQFILQSAKKYIQKFCHDNNAKQDTVREVLAQGGSMFIEANGELDATFNSQFCKVAATVFGRDASIQAQAEPQGVAGLYRAKLWWAQQSTKTKATVSSALHSGVVILWSGRVVSAVQEGSIVTGEFTCTDQATLKLAQCEPTTRNFIRAVCNAEAKAPKGTLIVVEPGSGNPGFTCINTRTGQVTFVGWDAKRGDQRGVKQIEGRHGEELKAELKLSADGKITNQAQLHARACELAQDSFTTFMRTATVKLNIAAAAGEGLNVKQLATCQLDSAAATKQLDFARVVFNFALQSSKATAVAECGGGGGGGGGGAKPELTDDSALYRRRELIDMLCKIVHAPRTIKQWKKEYAAAGGNPNEGLVPKLLAGLAEQAGKMQHELTKLAPAADSGSVGHAAAATATGSPLADASHRKAGGNQPAAGAESPRH